MLSKITSKDKRLQKRRAVITMVLLEVDETVFYTTKSKAKIRHDNTRYIET